MADTKRPKLAVWKFSSCDGCQLTILDCEDELLELAGVVEIAYFLEATRARVDGPYDLSLVEGSISTPDEVERIHEVRRESRTLVTIGACATAGGIQALRNFKDVEPFISAVYAHPEFIDTLARSTPVADHVAVDFELRGCPIDKGQLLELITATLIGRRPNVPTYSQCMECKRAGTVCVMVAHGTPCLGPVTQAGCGNLCPRCDRGCYGCFGPKETPNAAALSVRLGELGMDRREIKHYYRLFNANAPAFRDESNRHG
jgi:coenzyme F420-reducing hydrogenase gamma subunit